VNGSLWADDEYNVFYNPSYVNEFKKHGRSSERSRGRIFQSIYERMALGVYLNRVEILETTEPALTLQAHRDSTRRE